MEKEEILLLAELHDRENKYWIQQENEIGNRLRINRALTKADLFRIIDWKFESDGRLRTVEKKRIGAINEKSLIETSRLVFGMGTDQDLERVTMLCKLNNGIGPAVTSVILTFYDPKNYGIMDFHVWKELFGGEGKNLKARDYVRLLTRLRQVAKLHNLDVRTIEKAYFRKNLFGNKYNSKLKGTESVLKKQVKRTIRRKGVRDLESMRRDFLSQLLDKSNEKTRLFANISPPKFPNKNHWLSAKTGINGVYYQYVILKDSARVQLTMENKERVKNKMIFDFLSERSSDIEKDFGFPLIWDRLSNSISSRIKFVVANQGLENEDNWGLIQNQMVEKMILLEKALRKRLQELR